MKLATFLKNSKLYWQLKPIWCQPPSIILTGLFFIALPWLLFHIFWLEVVIFIATILWWTIFLILAPIQFEEYQSSINNVEK